MVHVRPTSRVRMVGDAPAGQSREDDSTPDSASDGSDMGEIAAISDPVNEFATGDGKDDLPGVDTDPAADTDMEDASGPRATGIIKGVLGESVIEEMEDGPAAVQGDEEDEEMDFSKLMSFDGLKIQKDENGEEIVEELEPPKMYSNIQAMRASREKFKLHESDTGSPEYQIASLTSRIAYMTEHIREHPKDHASTRGLLKMVARRTRLLKYLKRQDADRFHNIIKGLEIRISQQLRRL